MSEKQINEIIINIGGIMLNSFFLSTSICTETPIGFTILYFVLLLLSIFCWNVTYRKIKKENERGD